GGCLASRGAGSPGPGTAGPTPGGRTERDAGEDHRATQQLRGAERVAEGQGAGRGADERLEVEERPGQFRLHARLAVGEQRERTDGAGQGQRDQGEYG